MHIWQQYCIWEFALSSAMILFINIFCIWNITSQYVFFSKRSLNLKQQQPCARSATSNSRGTPPPSIPSATPPNSSRPIRQPSPTFPEPTQRLRLSAELTGLRPDCPWQTWSDSTLQRIGKGTFRNYVRAHRHLEGYQTVKPRGFQTFGGLLVEQVPIHESKFEKACVRMWSRSSGPFG